MQYQFRTELETSFIDALFNAFMTRRHAQLTCIAEQEYLFESDEIRDFVYLGEVLTLVYEAQRLEQLKRTERTELEKIPLTIKSLNHFIP